MERIIFILSLFESLMGVETTTVRVKLKSSTLNMFKRFLIIISILLNNHFYIHVLFYINMANVSVNVDIWHDITLLSNDA